MLTDIRGDQKDFFLKILPDFRMGDQERGGFYMTKYLI